MAHKKAGGSTALGRDSQGQRLGTKVGAGQEINAGAIMVRQKGTPIRAGLNVKRGRNDNLYSLVKGTVYFTQKKTKRFDGKLLLTKFANIKPKLAK